MDPRLFQGKGSALRPPQLRLWDPDGASPPQCSIILPYSVFLPYSIILPVPEALPHAEVEFLLLGHRCPSLAEEADELLFTSRFEKEVCGLGFGLTSPKGHFCMAF